MLFVIRHRGIFFIYFDIFSEIRMPFKAKEVMTPGAGGSP